MMPVYRQEIRLRIVPQTWLRRVGVGLVVVVAAALAMLLFAIALAASSILLSFALVGALALRLVNTRRREGGAGIRVKDALAPPGAALTRPEQLRGGPTLDETV